MKKHIITAFLTAAIVIGGFYSFGFTPTENKIADELDISTWPEASQKAAKEMEAKYGKPGGITSDMLIWKNNGIWLKTIVYRKEMKHAFPESHSDVVEQWINYSVPFNTYDELAFYNGSITVNRTNGTISAHCDNEAMNILAINLAFDIIKNNKNVDQARKDYGAYARAYMIGEKPSYTQSLNFNSDPSAPDADEPLKIISADIGGQKKTN